VSSRKCKWGGAPLVVAVICAVTPAASAAAGASAHHHVEFRVDSAIGTSQRQSLPALRAAMRQAPTAAAAADIWLQQQASGAQARLRSTRSDFGLDDFLEPGSTLEAVGQLTGRARPDVLDARLTQTHGRMATGVSVRDGRTGRALWTRKLTRAHQVAFPLAIAPVGPAATKGMLVSFASTKRVSATAQSVSVWIAAWSGRTGKTLWTSAPITGTVSRSSGVETDTGVPSVATTFHPHAGRIVDVLVPTESSVPASAGGAASASATATVVSGRHGAESRPYPTVTSTRSIPVLQPVADLNGDRRDDVLAIVPGHAGSLTAETGNTGRTLWTDHVSMVGFRDVSPVGRLSGGTAPDLAVSGRAVRLVRGRDGKPLWLKRASGPNRGIPIEAYRLGPAGPSRTPAVGLVSVRQVDSASRLGDVFVVRAVSASGHVVWTRRVPATMRFFGVSGSSTLSFESLGDVQPDGSMELGVSERLTSGTHHRTVAGTVSGRDGAFSPLVLGAPMDGSLVRGRGTDLALAASHRAHVRLSGYDGQSGARLFQTALPAPAHTSFAVATGLRVTGHRCSDIAMDVIDKRHQQTDVLSGSGAVLWQLRFGRRQAIGGHLTRYRAPTRFCAG
jgi:hypothetical protein